MLQHTAVDVSDFNSKINILGFDKLWDGKPRSKARMMRIAKRSLMPRTMALLIMAMYPTTNKASKKANNASATKSTTRLAYGASVKSHALWPEIGDPYSSDFAQLRRASRLPSGFSSGASKHC